MNKKLSFVEILKIIHQCSLTNQTRNQYMLALIDAMIINEADNPLIGLEDDTLKRIFTGSNPFPRERAKEIFSHRDEVKFSTFLRGIKPNLFLNIETEIQNMVMFQQHNLKHGQVRLTFCKKLFFLGKHNKL